MPKTYYAILKVSPKASQEAIDQAYRRLSERLHPTVRSDTRSYVKLKELNEAWQVLGDRYQRKQYDLALKYKWPEPVKVDRNGLAKTASGLAQLPPRPVERNAVEIEIGGRPYSPPHRIPTPLLALGALVLLLGNIVGIVGLVSYLNKSQPAVATLAETESTVLPEQASPGGSSELSIKQVVVSSCPEGCAAPLPGCRVKGDVDKPTGVRLYYLPTDQIYKQVVVDGDEGERWFCNEADAVQNGWARGSSTSLASPTRKVVQVVAAPTKKAAAKLQPTRKPTVKAGVSPEGTNAVGNSAGQLKYPAPELVAPSFGASYGCSRPLILEWSFPNASELGANEWFLVESKATEREEWFSISDWVKETTLTLNPVKGGGSCDAIWWPHTGVYEWRVVVIGGNRDTHTVSQFLSPVSASSVISYNH